LGRRANGDAAKVDLAAQAERQTPVPVRWITQRLHLGAPGYVHQILTRIEKERAMLKLQMSRPRARKE